MDTGGGAVLNGYEVINSEFTAKDTQFLRNHGRNGGAIWNLAGTLTMISATLDSNVSRAADTGMGGAIDNSDTAIIIGSSFAQNAANTGGAIANYGLALSVTNSTFVSNTASDDGARGGAFDIQAGVLTLENNTFHTNDSTGSGGTFYFYGDSFGRA